MQYIIPISYKHVIVATCLYSLFFGIFGAGSSSAAPLQQGANVGNFLIVLCYNAINIDFFNEMV